MVSPGKVVCSIVVKILLYLKAWLYTHIQSAFVVVQPLLQLLTLLTVVVLPYRFNWVLPWCFVNYCALKKFSTEQEMDQTECLVFYTKEARARLHVTFWVYMVCVIVIVILFYTLLLIWLRDLDAYWVFRHTFYPKLHRLIRVLIFVDTLIRYMIS